MSAAASLSGQENAAATAAEGLPMDEDADGLGIGEAGLNDHVYNSSNYMGAFPYGGAEGYPFHGHDNFDGEYQGYPEEHWWEFSYWQDHLRKANDILFYVASAMLAWCFVQVRKSHACVSVYVRVRGWRSICGTPLQACCVPAVRAHRSATRAHPHCACELPRAVGHLSIH